MVGGCYEEMIAVSTMGEVNLRYHHNKSSAAGMWGWLDTEMNLVIAPQYIFAEAFFNGRAIVCKGTWDIDTDDRYWCAHEIWGVINKQGEEIVPCMHDELYEIEGSEDLFLIHEGGWEKGHYSIFSIKEKGIILELDFDFDMGYMFNECFVLENNLLVFDEHIAGEGKELITVYDLNEKEYLLYQSENTERTFNGEKSLVVKKDGQDIIIF